MGSCSGSAARGGAPGGGRDAPFPDLNLVARVRVVNEDAAARGGVGPQAPAGRPGRVEVRALAGRDDAIDPAGLEAENEDVEHAPFIAARERDLRFFGARVEPGRLVVLALERHALGATARR